MQKSCVLAALPTLSLQPLFYPGSNSMGVGVLAPLVQSYLKSFVYNLIQPKMGVLAASVSIPVFSHCFDPYLPGDSQMPQGFYSHIKDLKGDDGLQSLENQHFDTTFSSSGFIAVQILPAWCRPLRWERSCSDTKRTGERSLYRTPAATALFWPIAAGAVETFCSGRLSFAGAGHRNRCGPA